MVSLSIGQSDDIFQTARVYASAGALNIQTGKPTFKDKSFHTYLKVREVPSGFLILCCIMIKN